MAHQLSSEVKERVTAYVNILRAEIPISSVYIFGSQAKNTAHPDSDIDVAIISPSFKGRSIEDGAWLQLKLWEAPYKNMDVVGYSPEYFDNENSPLISEIKKNGIALVVA